MVGPRCESSMFIPSSPRPGSSRRRSPPRPPGRWAAPSRFCSPEPSRSRSRAGTPHADDQPPQQPHHCNLHLRLLQHGHGWEPPTYLEAVVVFSSVCRLVKIVYVVEKYFYPKNIYFEEVEGGVFARQSYLIWVWVSRSSAELKMF